MNVAVFLYLKIIMEAVLLYRSWVSQDGVALAVTLSRRDNSARQ